MTEDEIMTKIRKLTELEMMELNYEAALCDLDNALNVLIRRIKGEADLDSAKQWLGLNYPKRFKEAFPDEEIPNPRS